MHISVTGILKDVQVGKNEVCMVVEGNNQVYSFLANRLKEHQPPEILNKLVIGNAIQISLGLVFEVDIEPLRSTPFISNTDYILTGVEMITNKAIWEKVI